ncbi:ATP-binding protein [Bacillus wiedmannii]|uniref:ATP-binding protein n=1 Tax=Bacillus wiedmannii TaxID=1890302 RepID=UPI0010BDA5C9|nr:ATP-binding protein [Bacillus wiedmannii]TKH19539.1 ATP-binding protein [Bacillus wiedmannii]
MARSKFDREFEQILEKHWKPLLMLGGAGFVWFSKDKIFIEVMRIVPTAADVMSRIGRLILLGIMIYALIRIFFHYLYLYFEKKRYRYVMMIPHIEDEVTTEKLGQMIRHVHGTGRKPLDRLIKGRDWYRMIMYRPDGRKERVRYYIGGPEDGLKRILQAIRSVYVHSEVYSIPKEEMPFPTRKAVGGRMILKRKRLEATLSLARYTRDVLPMLGSAMEENTWVDIAFSPDNGYRLTKGIRKAEKAIKKKKGHGLDAFEKEEIRALNKRFSKNEVAFQVSVSFASDHYPGVPVIKNLGHMVASIMADVNELRYRRLRRCIPDVPNPVYGKMVWTGSELLNLLHLPNVTGDKNSKTEKHILYLDKGEAMIPSDILSEGITIGHVMHPYIKDRLVKIREEFFKNHGYITGKVGSGKSTVAMMVMQSVIDKWIENPKEAGGLSLLDPTEDLAYVVLNRLLKAEKDGKQVDWSKVHFLRFRNTEYPPALNLLHRFPGEDIQTVVESVMEMIKLMIQGQAQQTERLLRAIIGTLLCDQSQNHTILSIPLFISDEIFRVHVLENLGGPEKKYYSHFWKHEVGSALEDSTQAILNRLDIFRNTLYLKRIYGQSHFSLEIRKWMDEGHLVFYDLAGMGKDDIQLTVGYIANQYHRIAQQRPHGSKLHLKVIDEAHDVQVPVLPKIIAKDRKHGLGLWVITQQVTGQLDRELTDMLTEAGGNYFVCRQGFNSAKTLEGIMQKQFRTEYLQNLANLVVAIQTQDRIDGDAQNVWCTIRVPPLERYLPSGKVANYQIEQEIQASNEWTKTKIKELERSTGKSGSEIDKEIDEFLYGKGKYLVSEKVMLKKEEPTIESGLDEMEEKASLVRGTSEKQESKEQVDERNSQNTQMQEIKQVIQNAQILPFRKQKEEPKQMVTVGSKNEIDSIESKKQPELSKETNQKTETLIEDEISGFDSWEKE